MRVRQAVVDAMVQHARETLPDECCGLLVGGPDEIARAERARNLEPSPTRFVVDPAAHFAAMRRARAEGLAVIGAYHSHPDAAAWPSATDIAEVSYPEFLQVIVSLATGPAEPCVRAFRLVEGNFQPVDLVLVG